MDSIGVMLIDSSRLLREGLKRLFEGTDFVVRYEFNSVGAAARGFPEEAPALILVEWAEAEGETEPGRPMRDLKALAPDARIVVLSDRMCIRRLSMAFEGGANGFLLKDMSPDSLTRSLQLVLLGEMVFPTELAGYLVSALNGAAQPQDMMGLDAGLSTREAQILRLLTEGQPNKVIARHLNITEGTVKVHLKGLLKKINAHNRTQAAIWALNHGFEPASRRSSGTGRFSTSGI